MSEIQIFMMQEDDIPACVQILLENPLFQRYGVTAESASVMFAAALAEGATILIARSEGQAVGFVWYVTTGAWDRSGYIRLISLLPEAQGQGVGERLMREAEIRRQTKSAEVFLLVSDFNIGAQRFYRRLGYEQVGSIPDYVIPGISERIFYKRLVKERGNEF